MVFGIGKCRATLIMKRGEEGMQLQNDDVIKNIEDGEKYKYLDILPGDGFKKLEMKEKVRIFM